MELDYLCIDIETYNVGSKPSPYTDNILMVSYVTADTAGVIVGGDWPDWLLGMLRDDKVLKIIQNSSFEAMFILHNYGIKIRNVWDTLAVERLLVAGDNISCALVDIVRRRLGKFLDKSLRDVISTGVIDEKTKQYCLDDSLVLFPIYEQQQKEIRSRNQEYVVELECLMSVMSGEIEYHGIGFDKKLWRSYVPILEKKRRDAERKVWDFLGFSYCDNLFGESTGALSLTCGSKVLEALSKKGIKLNDYKSETLQEYFYRNPGSLKGRIVSTILDYKRWDKALGWNYPKYIEPKTGRIHSSFNSQGTATFRFSSSKPNLQQVVKPYEDINFRHLFVASPGKVFVGGDYSQIELRILADLTGEQHYIDSFTKGTDLHLQVAEAILGRPIKDKSERNLGKAVNFGVAAFGGSERALIGAALDYGILLSRKQAKEYIERVRLTNKRVEDWGKQCLSKLIQQGYIQTPIGHRRVLVGDARETVARNTPVQSLAAGILKEGLRLVNSNIIDHYDDTKFVLTVHDEAILECDEGIAVEIEGKYKKLMIEAGQHWVKTVPIGFDTYIADRWQ